MLYSVDERDTVVALSDLPQSSVGAPLPVLLADEHSAALAYLADDPLDNAWDQPPAEESLQGDLFVFLHFNRVLAVSFGYPNDEAASAHPLYSRGLTPYGAYRVDDSSWIRALERANRVHPFHSPGLFAPRRHFALAFHDSVFECLADSYTFSLARVPHNLAYARLVAILQGRGSAA